VGPADMAPLSGTLRRLTMLTVADKPPSRTQRPPRRLLVLGFLAILLLWVPIGVGVGGPLPSEASAAPVSEEAFRPLPAREAQRGANALRGALGARSDAERSGVPASGVRCVESGSPAVSSSFCGAPPPLRGPPAH